MSANPAEQEKPRAPFNNRWETERFFTDNDAYFANILAEIGKAKKSVCIEVFIFERDHLGERFIAALKAAAAREVDVRVIMDGAGSFRHGFSIAEELRDTGVQVRIYHPLPWHWERFHLALNPGGFFARLRVLISEINNRDHRKLYLVDDVTGWAGSPNITADHLSCEAGGKGWHDFAVRVTGDSVSALRESFNTLWDYTHKKWRQKLIGNFWSSLSLRSRRRKNRRYLAKISQAKSRVWLCSAYFSPSRRMLRAIRTACERGVDVRIIVPAGSDVPFFKSLAVSYYETLQSFGARIYEYLPTMLHGKVLLADDQAIVGSTNFNHRSFLHDLEIDVLLHSADAVSSVESALLHDMSLSREWSPAVGERPGLRNWLLRIFRYWS